jgi:hypothetical protein
MYEGDLSIAFVYQTVDELRPADQSRSIERREGLGHNQGRENA